MKLKIDDKNNEIEANDDLFFELPDLSALEKDQPEIVISSNDVPAKKNYVNQGALVEKTEKKLFANKKLNIALGIIAVVFVILFIVSQI